MASLCVVDALLQVARECTTDDACINARCSALEALRYPAKMGEDRALAVLVSSLQDWHIAVRQVAVESLIQVALHGNRRVVYARILAIRALAPLAKSGDLKCVMALVHGLEDAHLAVRLASFEELARLASDGDSTDDEQVTARLAALKALIPVMEKGCQEALAVLSACLLDWHVAVRDAAADVLKDLVAQASGAPPSPATVAAEVAIEAFAPLALQGDTRAVDALISALLCLGHLRRKALAALAHVAIAGDSVTALAAKVSACKALGKLAMDSFSTDAKQDEESEGAVAALVLCLKDWHADVWRFALNTLCALAEASRGHGRCGQMAVSALTAKACEGETSAIATLSRIAQG